MGSSKTGFIPAEDPTGPYEFNCNTRNNEHTIVALEFGANPTPNLVGVAGYRPENTFGFASNYDAFFDLGTPGSSSFTIATFTVRVNSIFGVVSVAVFPAPSAITLLGLLVLPSLRHGRR